MSLTRWRVIMLRYRHMKRNVVKTLDPDTASDIVTLITDLRGQASVIEAVVRSLVELSNVVYTNYVTDQNIHRHSQRTGKKSS